MVDANDIMHSSSLNNNEENGGLIPLEEKDIQGGVNAYGQREEKQVITWYLVWVKFWGLPENFKTLEVAWKLHAGIGRVVDVGLFDLKGREVRFFKARVELEEAMIISLALMFMEDLKENNLKEDKVGEWAKAIQIDVRVEGKAGVKHADKENDRSKENPTLILSSQEEAQRDINDTRSVNNLVGVLTERQASIATGNVHIKRFKRLKSKACGSGAVKRTGLANPWVKRRVSGDDGFTAKFFQFYWDNVGEDMHKVVSSFFGGWRILKAFNHTQICPIAKVPGAKDITQRGLERRMAWISWDELMRPKKEGVQGFESAKSDIARKAVLASHYKVGLSPLSYV
ncbi:hypothetical protein PIB30_042141 [Stylosanthes scabra]|uniref:Uncharacterized protein n=1 Tax=Stylosanthes scabra TaxID=79078 RepID=A0ABU6YDZ3_9FABA|nr:hypothetical protein [Stylosanthes scabra]